MFAKINSSTLMGIDAIPVAVEVDVANGLPSFGIVGLPDGSVKEARDRVKAAIKNCGYPFPNKKITVNLAPADLRKEGSGFDLPIAVGILAATEVISSDRLENYLVVGELSLDGTLRPIPGVLPIVMGETEASVRTIIVPEKNGREASLASRLRIVAARSLNETVEILIGMREPRRVEPAAASRQKRATYPFCFSDIKGLQQAKRGLEIAASGMHNVILRGPPGGGKTLLARALPSIMPHWSLPERLETSKIYSARRTGVEEDGLIQYRPFRAPHHTVSDAGLIGGGRTPIPGEISLAHNGVLFLDELPEFRRHVLEALRQPLENGFVTISRAKMRLLFPSRFLLIGAMNPCPCGYHGDSRNECHCTDSQIQKYRHRISGPLLDRIDMNLDIGSMELQELQQIPDGESSLDIRRRVNRAITIQRERFINHESIHFNGHMGPKEIQHHCAIDPDSQRLLEMSIEKLGLSARGYHRILKLARTIADLGKNKKISSQHVSEAIQFRRTEVA